MVRSDRGIVTRSGIAALVCFGMLSAVGCGKSSTPTTPSDSSDGGLVVTVLLRNSRFTRTRRIVRVGQSVNWKNEDTIEHSATFNNGGYESGNIPALSAHDVPVQMNTAGTFAYRCRIHGEAGSIVVQP